MRSRAGRQSLLTRFLGLYDVEIVRQSGGFMGGPRVVSRHTLVVMNNVFPAARAGQITERFDLKGSTQGRECGEEERLGKGRHAVLKVGPPPPPDRASASRASGSGNPRTLPSFALAERAERARRRRVLLRRETGSREEGASFFRRQQARSRASGSGN
jgi:hypothetical protein